MGIPPSDEDFALAEKYRERTWRSFFKFLGGVAIVLGIVFVFAYALELFGL